MTVAVKAANGLESLKSAILEYLEKHPDGVGNSELARDFGLESDFQGRQRNYLSWSVIGLLVNEGRVAFQKKGRSTLYKLA